MATKEQLLRWMLGEHVEGLPVNAPAVNAPARFRYLAEFAESVLEMKIPASAKVFDALSVGFKIDKMTIIGTRFHRGDDLLRDLKKGILRSKTAITEGLLIAKTRTRDGDEG